MMEKPEALRIADSYEEAETHEYGWTDEWIVSAANELTRQHALILEMRVALGALIDACVSDGWPEYGAHPYVLGLARTALTKAEPK